MLLACSLARLPPPRTASGRLAPSRDGNRHSSQIFHLISNKKGHRLVSFFVWRRWRDFLSFSQKRRKLFNVLQFREPKMCKYHIKTASFLLLILSFGNFVPKLCLNSSCLLCTDFFKGGENDLLVIRHHVSISVEGLLYVTVSQSVRNGHDGCS